MTLLRWRSDGTEAELLADMLRKFMESRDTNPVRYGTGNVERKTAKSNSPFQRKTR